MPVLVGKAHDFVSMDGQYRGPTPSMMPAYMGDLSRLARMTSWVRSLVYGDPARQLFHVEHAILPAVQREGAVRFAGGLFRIKAEGRGRGVASVLALALGEIDGASKDPARRAVLKRSTCKPSSWRESLRVDTVSPMRPPPFAAGRHGGGRA